MKINIDTDEYVVAVKKEIRKSLAHDLDVFFVSMVVFIVLLVAARLVIAGGVELLMLVLAGLLAGLATLILGFVLCWLVVRHIQKWANK